MLGNYNREGNKIDTSRFSASIVDVTAVAPLTEKFESNGHPQIDSYV